MVLGWFFGVEKTLRNVTLCDVRKKRQAQIEKSLARSIVWLRVLRAELYGDVNPVISSRLWKAEQKLREALRLIEDGHGGLPR